MTENTGTIPTPPPAPYPSAPRPPLRRSRTDRVLGGVASGFARWLGIDPVVVRVILVVLAVFGGSGLLLYAIGWLFIPAEGEPRSEADRLLERSRQPGSASRIVLIVLAVVVGLIVLGGIASTPWVGSWGGGGWLLLLAVGGLVLWLVNRPTTTSASGAPPATTWPPAADPPTTVLPTAVLPTTVVATTVLPDVPATPPVPAAAPGETAAPVPPVPPAPPVAGYAYGGFGAYPGYATPTPVPAPPPRPRSYLGLATASLALVTMGVLASLSISGLVVVPPVVVPAAGLGVLGLGLLVGAVAGRGRWLIALALPLLLVTALAALVPAGLGARMGNGIGDRRWTPTTTAEAAGPFRLGLGSAVLDLSDLALPPDGEVVVPVAATVGIGELRVIAPAGARVLVTAHVGVGEIAIDGMRPVNGQDRTVTTQLEGPVDPALPTIDLTADVAIGDLEVSRA
jgi:phage shock protein PspC (stress-responsive transcriptional regulator)